MKSLLVTILILVVVFAFATLISFSLHGVGMSDSDKACTENVEAFDECLQQYACFVTPADVQQYRRCSNLLERAQ